MTATASFCQSGQRVLDIEIDALNHLKQYINDDFANACALMMQCEGKVIVMGMGKSGHIGCKIAASLASTGTPSFFVHPGEASHGDLGMIGKKDVVLAISNSGEAGEILFLAPVLSRLGIPMICMTGNPESSMAKLAKVHLQITVPKEACPLNLAPTSSTTATLAMGDALAIALLEARGFTAEDFALSHPGGALGRKLLLKIGDIMRQGDDLPCIQPTATVAQALFEITQKGLGMTAVVDANQQVLGIFTDGDLRRLFERNIDLKHTEIGTVMTANPHTTSADLLAAEGLLLMEQRKITSLLVVNEQQQLIGALQMHDLLKAGVV